MIRSVRHASVRSTFAARRAHRRKGFTLLEVLIATAVTLLMMISLAQIFKIIGDSMQQGRAVLELNNRLRSVTQRLRLDLQNLTAVPNPPADPATAGGYLKIYDGSLTDYSAALYSASLGIPDLSRYGDVDDILLGTVQAGDIWFTGKVPLFVLQRVAPNASNTGLVTIASQHAEIAVFAEPVVSNVGNDFRSINPLVADPNNYEVIPGTDLPARYRLHYRTLLIRPDLNTGGVLPSGTVGGTPWLVAQPSAVAVGSTTVALPSPTCDMMAVHQQCDLSVRRVNPFATSSNVAANSLEDLVNPANRFAHVQVPLTAGAVSMPILALSPKINMPYTLLDAGSTSVGSPATPGQFQSGFLHPAFTLAGDRAGEDVLATDILSFDIKGFDPAVPLIASYGIDGGPGRAGVDDDGTGTADDASETGWAGTDDVILSPNDPGYGPALAAGAPVMGTGEFVDLAWGWKTRVHHLGIPIPAAANTWSQLSGLSAPWTPAAPFTEALYKSGLVVHDGSPLTSGSAIIFQPAYDTWYTRYEGDGILQAELASTTQRGLVRVTDVSGSGPALREAAWRGGPGNYVIDAGNDGIDNPGSLTGIDDISELETSPPYRSQLRGLLITVRMEDANTREVKQMSVSREFVTQ